MTKYIYAIGDAEDCSMEYKTIIARNLESAKEKIANNYFNEFDDIPTSDWDDVKQYLWESNIILGEPVDIETF